MALNDDWLSLTREETLEPDLPICDSHHHLWDAQSNQIAPRYLLDELLEDIGSGHNVVSTVFVQCLAMHRAHGPEAFRPVGETEFVDGVAAMSASGLYGDTRVAAGIVGHADLAQGDSVAAVLDAHIAAGGGRFRGIRHIAAWDPNDEVNKGRLRRTPKGLLMDARFRRGFAALSPRNLSFEGWLYHTQIGDLTDLARAFPHTTIVLNHFGSPLGIGPYAGRQSEILAQWRLDIAELATCPNVVAKLGGINMAINGFGWHERERPPTSQELVEATTPYYEHCLEHFGADRCMFESNFPVEKISCSYNVLWNSFKRIAAGCSADEKAKLFHDTASRVYRLDDVA